ncbi:hypothetical protein D7Y04_02330 [Corallococcus sp. AB038B]|nr:hypothetical protein D7Y04_02330 [Corallococcus sp. AB038B]
MKLTAALHRQTTKSMGEVVVLLEITSGDGAFYLFRLGTHQQPLGDTWHPSLEEAMRQAKYEFSAGPVDWIRSDD